MNDLIGAHNELHSEQGGLKGEHCGRARNPVIKVTDIAWLEFEKPDLQRAEAFARAFGFATSLRTGEELHLRGSDSTAPCVIVRRGNRSRFLGVAFAAVDGADLLRLATATGARTRPLPAAIGGMAVDLVDPGGVPVHVVAGMHSSARCRRRLCTATTWGTIFAASTPLSARVGSRPPCNGSVTSSCSRRNTSRR